MTNAGAREGDEVVQLYVRHLDSRIGRPQKELRGFQRITLAAGAATTVALPLAGRDLAYWDAARHAWTVESDHVEIMIGSSSAERDLTQRLTLAVGP